jgi:hypothetical protein
MGLPPCLLPADFFHKKPLTGFDDFGIMPNIITKQTY